MIWSRLKPYRGLWLILLLYFSIAVLTSLRAPLSAGPDEVAHFMFARFLKKEGYLPLTPEERRLAGYKSDQPPLNAALVALASFPADLEAPPFAKLTHDMPRRHLVIGWDNIPAWLAIQTEDPWAGEILLWRTGRFLSIIFSGLTLVVIYYLALIIFEEVSGKHLAATATVMSIAFLPTFTFVGSVLSYEGLLGLWAALYLLVAAYLIKRQAGGWLYLAAGLFIGLAIVTKLSALVAPLSLLVLIGITGYRAGWPKQKYITRLAWSLFGVLIGSGWWFTWVELKLNRVDELGWIVGLIYPILIADGSDDTSVEIAHILSGGKIGALVEPVNRITLSMWVQRLFRTFWSQWPFSEITLLILLVIFALVAMGLVRVWRQQQSARLWLIFLGLHISIFFILPLVRFVTIQQITAGNGRHVLFPALGAFAILITWGLSAWLPARGTWPWLGGAMLGLGLLLWSIQQGVQIYRPPLPVRTVSPDLPTPAQVKALDFGAFALAGYELKGVGDDLSCCDPISPVLGVDLYWVAQEFAHDDYQIEVSLVDSQDQRQSVWVGYPADGRYPTKAWEPGDRVRTETWLPLAGLKQGKYSLKLRLLAPQGPAAIENRSEFTLSELSLAKAVALPEPVNGTAFYLWQGGQVVQDMPSFAPRATIQLTTANDVTATLIGPDGVAWEPQQIGGQTHAFIVDPRWPKGDYHLRLEADALSTWESGPLLFAFGEGRKTDPPQSQVNVQANFANQIMLLGYNISQRRFMPGDFLPITLNWQALQSMPADFIMFTRLRDQQGRVWGGYDRKPREAYSTLFWIANEVVEDTFALQIAPNAPVGLYYLDVGWYLPVGEAPVSLPIVQAGQMSEVTSVTIGPFKVGQNSAGVTTDSPQPQHKLDQPFGPDGALVLLGYDLRDDETGSTAKLTLYWETKATLSTDYTTFVHLRNAEGDVMAQKDQPPLNGAYPTGLWDPGERIVDEISLPLPAELPAGVYQIVMGLYDFQTGQRLAIPGQSDHSLTLKTITINR